MAFPAHLDKEKLDALLTIIERNRWDRLRHRQLDQEVVHAPVESEGTEISADSVRVVLFGAQSPFAQSLIEMFKVLTVITYFDDPERMIAFCLDHFAFHYSP
jgi:hypothetical protein